MLLLLLQLLLSTQTLRYSDTQTHRHTDTHPDPDMGLPIQEHFRCCAAKAVGVDDALVFMVSAPHEEHRALLLRGRVGARAQQLLQRDQALPPRRKLVLRRRSACIKPGISLGARGRASTQYIEVAHLNGPVTEANTLRLLLLVHARAHAETHTDRVFGHRRENAVHALAPVQTNVYTQPRCRND